MPVKVQHMIVAIIASAMSGSAVTVIASVIAFGGERSDALRTISQNTERIEKMEGLSSEMRDNQIRIMMALGIDPKMPLPNGLRRGRSE